MGVGAEVGAGGVGEANRFVMEGSGICTLESDDLSPSVGR